MANAQLKTREVIGSAIDKELLKQLRDYSKESGIPLSRLIDKAIEQFLKSTKK